MRIAELEPGGVIAAEVDEVFDGDAERLAEGERAEDGGDGDGQDDGARGPAIDGRDEQHGDDDEAGDEGGGEVHEGPGVLIVGAEVEVADGAAMLEGVPGREELGLAALGAAESEAAREDEAIVGEPQEHGERIATINRAVRASASRR